jgi:hypothetical protein
MLPTTNEPRNYCSSRAGSVWDLVPAVVGTEPAIFLLGERRSHAGHAVKGPVVAASTKDKAPAGSGIGILHGPVGHLGKEEGEKRVVFLLR